MKLTLTDQQAQVLVDSLDLFSRILLGQLESVAHVMMKHEVSKLDDTDWEYYHILEERLRSSKYLLGFERNGGLGIHNEKVDDNARVAYDVQQVLRNHLAWKRNPDGGILVCFDKPHKTSTTQELPILED